MRAPADLDEVFRALADPGRRMLLDGLRARDGQTLKELCAGLPMTRQSVSKHLAVLEGAHLITTLRRGREKLHYLNAGPIAEISERWINRYDARRVEALSDLKNALEEHEMERPRFVYETYIRTTPELLWRALTEPAFTRRYWGLELESSWEEGAAYTMRSADGSLEIADAEQIVLVVDPPRRLAYTWHSFTPEWAAHYGHDEVHRSARAAEPRSRVTFELQPAGEEVCLTVVHEGFEPDSAVLASVSTGWPRVLSSLKTMLELGESA